MPSDSSTSADQRAVAIRGDVQQSPIVTDDDHILTIIFTCSRSFRGR